MLRRQHELGGRLGQEEVRSRAGGLLRVHAPQERGRSRPEELCVQRTPRLTPLLSQAARVMALQAAYRKAELNQGRENAPTAGQIRNLGLLNKEEDTKKVLGASS